MNEQRFAEIVSAYGAAPRRWPEAERAAAQAFAAAHAAIAEPLLKRAAALDATLDADEAAAPSDLLAARILNTAKLAPARMDWRPLAALAACAVFGLVAGFGLGGMAPRAPTPAPDFTAEQAIGAAFGQGATIVDWTWERDG